jgi:methanogenic corrinoid protein MtbC1
MKKSDDLVQSIVDLREAEAIRIVKMRLDTGEDPLRILDDTREALMIVGQRFETGDYFIPELIFSGEIMKGISALIKPLLTGEIKREYIGTVVIGTVKGDIHDIGKDMVSFMLEINGFKVHDLGVDVSTDRFVTCVKETKAQVVGLSAFLTGCIESMKATVLALQDAGLRDNVKIMIGGNFISDLVCNEVGADGWGIDAGAAVRLARMWTRNEG